ncbi:MAG: hypothetical protein K2J94_00880, partial [Duncaniella sp.]|nr:hypothetical protein [Duncaniella sp.]
MLSSLAVSCSDDVVSSSSVYEYDGVERTVSLNLQSEGFIGDASRASRAIGNGLVDENTIKDYWLIE